MRKYCWLLFSALLFIAGCTPTQHISTAEVNYTSVSKNAGEEDAEINALVAPYKLQLDEVMNEVLAVLPEEMAKKQPESPLGNWVSDVIMTRLKKDGYQVDFAVVNYGGLRIPYLSAGPLTRGKIYELTPFDNTVMIMDIPGTKLDSFLMNLASAGGWPISKEVKLVISNKKLVSAHINTVPLDPNRVYKVATLDYVANGGDNMKVLIPLSRVQTGLIFRDVLIEHAIATTAAGQTITAKNDGRVIIQ